MATHFSILARIIRWMEKPGKVSDRAESPSRYAHSFRGSAEPGLIENTIH